MSADADRPFTYAPNIDLSQFEVARGSVAGADHVRKGINNQDGVAVIHSPHAVVGVVCDGCGSAPSSEVGSLIASRLIAYRVADLAHRYPSLPLAQRTERERWEHILLKVRDDVLAQLRVLGNSMDESMSGVVATYLLFTTVGFAVTPVSTVLFSIGDGYYNVEGSGLVDLGPFEGNKPPYLGYSLLGQDQRFLIMTVRPTYSVSHVAVTSDGFEDFLASEDLTHPGTSTAVGPVSQFWTEDNYFSNLDAIRRKLTLVNKPKRKILYDEKRTENNAGLLKDDTTIAVARRRRPEVV